MLLGVKQKKLKDPVFDPQDDGSAVVPGYTSEVFILG